MTDEEMRQFAKNYPNLKNVIRNRGREVVVYESREYNALLAIGYVVIEQWYAPDGVSWVRMKGA